MNQVIIDFTELDNSSEHSILTALVKDFRTAGADVKNHPEHNQQLTVSGLSLRDTLSKVADLAKDIDGISQSANPASNTIRLKGRIEICYA